MKINIFFLLVALMAIACDPDPTNTSCLPQNIEKSIIAFYPFSSGTLTDYSKYSNTLINNKSSLTEDRNGNQNCAYSFKKSDGTFLKGNAIFTDGFSIKPFSISLWYKPLSIRAPGDLEILLSRTKNDNSNLLPHWSVGLGDCRVAEFSVFGKFIRDDKNNNLTCDELQIDLSEKWHHLACTFNGSQMKLYRNGIISNRMQDLNPFGPAFNNEGEMFIGLDFTGSIDDVIIFDKELSSSEILTLYNTEPCCF